MEGDERVEFGGGEGGCREEESEGCGELHLVGV
jgi:hypothetical protein